VARKTEALAVSIYWQRCAKGRCRSVGPLRLSFGDCASRTRCERDMARFLGRPNRCIGSYTAGLVGRQRSNSREGLRLLLMPLTDGGPEQVASPSKRANLQNRIGMNFPICRSCARISVEDGAHFKGRIEIDPAKSEVAPISSF
jgi:hypothetical protein